MTSAGEETQRVRLEEQTLACREVFRRCISNVDVSVKRWLELRLADFMLWADGLGALVSGRASIDNRLTDRPDLKDIIGTILEHLEKGVNDLRHVDIGHGRTHNVRPVIVDKNDPPNASFEAASTTPKDSVAGSISDRSYSSWSGSSDIDENDAAEGPHEFKHDTKSMQIITADLVKLNRLSALIKRSTAYIRFERSDRSFKLGDHEDLKNDMISSLTRRMLGAATYYERILNFRLSNPGTIKEGSDAGAYDKKLIRVIDRWRCERLTEETTKIQGRLINAVLRRRHRINDARARAIGIEYHEISSRYQPKKHYPIIDAAKKTGLSSPMPKIPGTNKDNPSVDEISSSLTATAVGSRAEYRSIAPSRSARSGLSATGAKTEFPRPRIGEGAMSFRCPICSQATEREESEEVRWRKHVKEDLQPYICIYENCLLPDRLYSSTDEWRKHIHMYHSTTTWECSVCVQNPIHIQHFKSAAEMEAHLRSAHLQTHVLTDSQIDVAIDKGTQSAPFVVDICPICTTTRSQLVEEGAGEILDHIATELLDLAFEAVVRNDDLCDLSGGSERANPQDDFSQDPRAGSISGPEMNERISVTPSTEDDQTYTESQDSASLLTIKSLKKLLDNQLMRYDSLENFINKLPLNPEDFVHHEETKSLISTSDATIRYPSSSTAMRQRCLAWLYSPVPRRVGTRQVEEKSDVFYISGQKLLEFMQSAEIAALSMESSDTEAKANFGMIRTAYPRVFTILLYIGHESLVSRACSSLDFEDRHLPFGPDKIQALSRQDDFVEAFMQQQWIFCVPSFNDGIDSVFPSHSILPFTIDFPIGQGGTARIAHITFDPEYNKMSSMGLIPTEHSNENSRPLWTWMCTNCMSGLKMRLKTTQTCDHCNARVTEDSQLFDQMGRVVHTSEILDKSKKHVFALKTYRSQAASKFFGNERAAFQTLQTNTGPLRGIITCFGSFVHGDSFNNIIEYAELGDLSQLMQLQVPPRESEEKMRLWTKILELIHGLARIHSGNNVESGNSYRGWHFDIKPGNVLIVKDVEESPYPYIFKLAGFAWSHFESLSMATPNAILYEGTYAYGAPESRWYNSSESSDPRPVTSSVDVWSLGCVFSEAAIWIANGCTSVEEYREQRQDECVRKLHPKVGDPFHDGTEVLDAVRIAHAGVAHDTVSYGVTRDLVDSMLVPSNQRPSAENLALLVDGIIKRAEDDVTKQAKTKSRSPRRTSKLTSRKTAPLSISKAPKRAKSVEKKGVWDSIDQYRLDEKTVESFLRDLFGNCKFHINRKLDEFQFWVPRRLTDAEKYGLLDRRKE